MVEKKKLFLFISISFIFVFSLILIHPKFNQINNGYLKLKINNKNSLFLGEKIIYDVKMGRFNLGRAIFHYLGSRELDGKLLNLMVFETDIARFKDVEKIYSDPETFLPVKIERDIIIWFKQEKITEEYDQENFTLAVTKYKEEKSDKTIVRKDAPIQNAILLPHCVRDIKELKPGYTLIANLPNRKFRIELISIEEIKVPAGTFQAYHFVSLPRQIEIWVSADELRIPLKIQGIGVFNYLMELKEYQPDGRLKGKE